MQLHALRKVKISTSEIAQRPRHLPRLQYMHVMNRFDPSHRQMYKFLCFHNAFTERATRLQRSWIHKSMPIHAAHRTRRVLCPQNPQYAIHQGGGDLAKRSRCSIALDSYHIVVIQQSVHLVVRRCCNLLANGFLSVLALQQCNALTTHEPSVERLHTQIFVCDQYRTVSLTGARSLQDLL